MRTDLDFRLDIVDCVTALHFKCDSLPCQGLHEDLHLSASPGSQQLNPSPNPGTQAKSEEKMVRNTTLMACVETEIP